MEPRRDDPRLDAIRQKFGGGGQAVQAPTPPADPRIEQIRQRFGAGGDGAPTQPPPREPSPLAQVGIGEDRPRPEAPAPVAPSTTRTDAPVTPRVAATPDEFRAAPVERPQTFEATAESTDPGAAQVPLTPEQERERLQQMVEQATRADERAAFERRHQMAAEARQGADPAPMLRGFQVEDTPEGERAGFLQRVQHGFNQMAQAGVELPAGLLGAASQMAAAMGDEREVEEMFTANLAEALRAEAAARFPTDESLQHRFLETMLPAAIGSFGSFIGGGAVMRALGRSPARFAVTAAAAGGADQMYREARQMGADEDTARLAGAMGLAPGAVQVFPVVRALNRFNRASGGQLSRTWLEVLKQGGLGALEEGIVEGAGQVGFNEIARRIFDEDRELLDGLIEASGAGGSAGFLASALLTMAGMSRGPSARLPRPAVARRGDPMQDQMAAPAAEADPRIDAIREKFGAPREPSEVQPEAPPVEPTPRAPETPAEAPQAEAVPEATETEIAAPEQPPEATPPILQPSEPPALPERQPREPWAGYIRRAGEQMPEIAISPEEAATITEADYMGRVARESVNPQEIAETILMAEQMRAEPDPLAEQLAAMGGFTRSQIEGFAERGGHADFGRWIVPESRARHSGFDEVADEMSRMFGREITTDDVLDVMRRYESPAAVRRGRDVEHLDELKRRFEEITGTRWTRRLSEQMTPAPVAAGEAEPVPFQRIRELATRDRGLSSEATAPPRQEQAQRARALPETPTEGAPRADLAAPDAPGTPQAQRVQEVMQQPRLTRTPRVDVAPEPGFAGKKTTDIILDFAKAVGAPISRTRKARGSGGDVAGMYYPGSARTTVRFTGDMDTAAHEIAHFLDDRYGILREWSGQPNAPTPSSPFDGELFKFAFHGSGGHDKSLAYNRAEGVAEWARAYVVNPAEAERIAPKFTEHFRETVPQEAQQAIEQFGTEVRQWAGAPATERTAAHVRAVTAEEIGEHARREGPVGRAVEAVRDDRAAREGRRDGDFALTLGDRAATAADHMHPAIAAFSFAANLRGMEEVAPTRDFRRLVRLFNGNEAEINRVLDDGPHTFDRVGRMTDETGQEIGGIAWLHEPMADAVQGITDRRRQRETTNTILRGTIALTINQRVIEERGRLMEWAERIVDGEQTIETAEGELRQVRRQISELETELADLRLRKRRDGSIARVQEKLKEARAQRTEINKTLQSARADVREARRELGYTRKDPSGARAHAERRAQRLTGTGAGVYSDVTQAREALKEIENDATLRPVAEEMARRLRAFHGAVLDFLVDAGRYSREQVDQIRADHQQYVALNRVLDQADPRVANFARKGGLGTGRQIVQRFRGSTLQIENPYVSLMAQVAAAVTEARRIETINSFNAVLHEDRGLYEGDQKRFAQIGYRLQEGETVPPEVGNAVKTYVEGREERWIYQPDVHKALTDVLRQAPSRGHAWFRAVFGAPVRISRAIITSTPDFLVRNVWRDSLQRTIISLTGSKPWQSLTNFRDLDQYRKDFETFERTGAGLFGFHGRHRSSYYARLNHAIRQAEGRPDTIMSLPGRMVSLPGRMVSGWQRMATHSEYSSRIAEFKSAWRQAKGKGMSDADAAVFAASEARAMTDYAISGRVLRELNHYVLFLNAATQGTLAPIRQMRKGDTPEARRRAALGVFTRLFGWTLSMTVLARLWNVWQGEEVEEELKQQPAYLRDMFWNFKIGDDLWLRIPRPFELGIPSALAERSFDAVSDAIRGNPEIAAHNMDGFARSAVQSVVPFNEGLIFGPYVAVGETWANYDFFRQRRIIPPWEEQLKLELRDVSRASPAGQFLQDIIGMDARNVEHLIQAHTGGLGRSVIRASDIAHEDPERRRDAPRRAGMVVGGLFVGSPGFAARDVQWVMDWARSEGRLNDPQIQTLRGMLSDINEMDTPADRDEMMRHVREYATELRRALEAAERTR